MAANDGERSKCTSKRIANDFDQRGLKADVIEECASWASKPSAGRPLLNNWR
ncbi:hypothetical protein DEV92_107212 [Phyllobacterium myrsinacearum]|nr:hypothetical protein DEV92_107212 [Phyllobacterium myrsinacearum]RZV05319.1 hypothetical protein EV654_2764 [Phyllobacterium myrsinacearum]